MSGYGVGFVVRRLMRGKTPAQVERAFWIVVVTLSVLFIGAYALEHIRYCC